MATTSSAVAGTVASSVIQALSQTQVASSAAVTVLQGLLANLQGATTDAGRSLICQEMMRVPNAGIAGQIAEKLWQELQGPDSVQRSLQIMSDMSYLQAAINAQSHQSGVLSRFLQSMGL